MMVVERKIRWWEFCFYQYFVPNGTFGFCLITKNNKGRNLFRPLLIFSMTCRDVAQCVPAELPYRNTYRFAIRHHKYYSAISPSMIFED